MDQVLVVIAIKFGGQLDILWTSWWSIKLFGTRLVVSSAASDTRSTPRRVKLVVMSVSVWYSGCAVEAEVVMGIVQ